MADLNSITQLFRLMGLGPQTWSSEDAQQLLDLLNSLNDPSNASASRFVQRLTRAASLASQTALGLSSHVRAKALSPPTVRDPFNPDYLAHFLATPARLHPSLLTEAQANEQEAQFAENAPLAYITRHIATAQPAQQQAASSLDKGLVVPSRQRRRHIYYDSYKHVTAQTSRSTTIVTSNLLMQKNSSRLMGMGNKTRTIRTVPALQHANTQSPMFFELPQLNNSIQLEYIWIGGSGEDIRSKTKTINFIPNSVDDLPTWNFDGSSTNQAPGQDSEVLLKPCAIFRDPFRRENRYDDSEPRGTNLNLLVLCDTYTPQGEPLPSNKRHLAVKVFDQDRAAEPWFGIEQEYTLFSGAGSGLTPLGWPTGGFPAPQGPYYCGNGTHRSFGKAIVEAHYQACLFSGVKISGTNGEVMPGQWEFQVGPCTGIDAGDHLWIARYLLLKVAEHHNVQVSFDPKPVQGDWNGAGCHTNFSTAPMRTPGQGWAEVMRGIEHLKQFHEEHLRLYDASGGQDNKRRLTGAHETASWENFSYGVANRGASVRIPRTTEAEGHGYFEDRRPASNMEPYLVTAAVFSSAHLGKSPSQQNLL